MKIVAYDRKQQRFIPQEDFAITGDGKLLIARDDRDNLLSPVPEFAGFWENEAISISDIDVRVEFA